MRYVIVDSNKVIMNIIEWDGQAPYDPGAGLELYSVNAFPNLPIKLDTNPLQAKVVSKLTDFPELIGAVPIKKVLK